METGTVSSEDQIKHIGVCIWSLYSREQMQGSAQLDCTLNKHSELLKNEGTFLNMGMEFSTNGYYS